MLNLQNPRLFSDSNGGRTMISTLGAFVARPNERGVHLSGSTSEGTWVDGGTEYTTWDEDAIGSLHGTRAGEFIGLQQDIGEHEQFSLWKVVPSLTDPSLLMVRSVSL